MSLFINIFMLAHLSSDIRMFVLLGNPITLRSLLISSLFFSVNHWSRYQ
uniref:Uncharacterized protein n=1 Tax=Ascaris lumbricoides TaxID=6252 RepID=A0A0M3IDQ4_ASCLU